MKKILVIFGNPTDQSFGSNLANEYIIGAKQTGHEVKTIHLNQLQLEKYLSFDYKSHPHLTPALIEAQTMIKWADHLVFAFPIWWTTPPALVKTFLEIVLQPNFAYRYQSSIKIDRLLKGKTGRLLITLDAPPLYYKLIIGDPAGKMMARGTLKFCGVWPVYKNYFGSVKLSDENKKKKWLAIASHLGLRE